MQERGDAAPRFKYVDGDLVKRWLDENGDCGGLVRDGCEADVERLFRELAEKLRGSEGEGAVSDVDIFEWVERWLIDVLMPLL